MTRTSIIILFLLPIFILSCGKDDEVKVITFIVASEKILVNDNGVDREFLQVKYNPNDQWTLLKENIDNFDYSVGYEYVIEVNRRKTNNMAADAPYYSYSLIRVVSKSLKQ